MRKIALAVFVALSPLLSACHSEPAFNAASADANEDAALNALQAENNEAEGAGYAGVGLIPSENGQLPMANVQ
jgi:hypothetical protein